MIDGIKIDCSYLHPNKWRDNELLEPEVMVKIRTGDIGNKMKADFNGLHFNVKESIGFKDRAYMLVAGSLHKYHNKGLHNYDDFTHSDLLSTISNLKKQFSIDPEKTLLRNLEFGVNIKLPITAQEFLKGIICMPDKEIGLMNISRPKVGRRCKRGEHSLKIYDKGMLEELPDKNLLRVEMKVYKMRYLDKYGISKLADLRDPKKLAGLGCVLLSNINEVVYYNSCFDNKNLSKTDKLRIDKYTSHYRWMEMSTTQRYKFKKSMRNFFNKYDETDLKKVVLLETYKKWKDLINLPQQMGDDFTAFFKSTYADKRVMFSPFRCTVKSSPLVSTNSKSIGQKKAVQKPIKSTHPNGRKICPICGRDISLQKQSSRFCSEKYHGPTARRCRDKAHNQKRVAANKARVQNEIKVLSDLISLMDRPSYVLDIVWRVAPNRKAVKNKALVNWQQLTAPVNFPLSRVCSVAVIPVNGDKIELTTVRAKKLISEIINFNHSQN